MPGYLEAYGVGEARREKRVKRLLLALLAIVVVCGTLYLVFRNYREVRQAKLFVELLRKPDYRGAYRLWGCTEASPCKDYPFESFMADWGPRSPHADLSAAKIVSTRGCEAGVILRLDFGKSQEDLLWVSRGDRTIGFAPWPVCNPRMKMQ